MTLSRCGGIGRHKGLKIPRRKKRTGSTPVSGTKNPNAPLGVLGFFVMLRQECWDFLQCRGWVCVCFYNVRSWGCGGLLSVKKRLFGCEKM